MDDKEFSNVFSIPANYTDSGKILGGMLEPRNAIEALVLIVLLGYPELMLIPMPSTIRIVVMTVTLIPLGVVAMMGIDGDSLFQYLGHIIYYMMSRRKLTFRRVGYKYVRVHAGTNIPVGSLANHELRSLRRTAHHYFDQLHLSGYMSKQDAYQWLADLIMAPLSEAHIGHLGEYYCKLVIEESRKLLDRSQRIKQVPRFQVLRGGAVAS